MTRIYYQLVWRSIGFIGFLAILAMGIAAQAADPAASTASPKLESLTPAQTRDVEAILRSLLKKHPEIITEALEEMAAREKLAASDKEKIALKALLVDLTKNMNAPVIGNVQGDVTVVE